MDKKVAVAEGLSGLGRLLREEGYTVVGPEAGEEVIAVVVTGMDSNLMGMQDIRTAAPVIDATGQTADQILRRIRELS
ncbi:MAG: YkuS family protein [Syntrophomonadaceae bacterium]|nr:YkuS family protein [Syntrophomonadaceae bacterium]